MANTERRTINEALLAVGEPGKYQLLLLLFIFVPGALTAMQTLVVVFSQAGMGYRCQDEFPALNSTTDGNTTLNSSMMLEYNKCPEDVGLQCSGFTYNSTVFTSTIISEFDLVCGRSWIPTYINVFYMLIRLPAGLVLGQFIDRLGRKKAVLIGLFLQGAIGVASAYSVNVEMYTVFRTLSAIPVIAIWDSLATLLSEVTTPHKRPHILMGMIFAWGTGIVALSPFGYLIRDWRTLQMAISVPSFIFLIAGYWMYDESPHWLYSQGKYKEAQLVVDKIARWNRIPSFQMSSADPAADGDKSEEIQDSGESSLKNSCGRIIKSKTLMAILAVCAFSWLATNMGYTGLAFGLGSLAGDVYLNNLISGVTEFFAYCICFLVIPGGRKLIFVILMIVGGLGLVSSAVVVDFAGHLTWLIILTTMIGRLSLAAGWQIQYLWCLELFPTTIRLTMVQISMMTGHIGSAVAPIINDLPKHITNPTIRKNMISPSVYGVLLIVSGLLAIYLPETNNKALPVSLDSEMTDTKRGTQNTGESAEKLSFSAM